MPKPIAPTMSASRSLARGCVLLLAVLLVWWPSPIAARAEAPPLEYQVKASMLFNFLQFVQWPPDAVSGRALRVCALRPQPFGAAFEALEGDLVNGKEVETVELNQLSEAAGCHLLFVGRSSGVDLQQIKGALVGSSTLLVGESPGFLEQGGMINFLIDAGRLRFEINERAAFESRLELSSKLLELASRVERR